MRSALPAILLMIVSLPAWAVDVAEPDPIRVAYDTRSVGLSRDVIVAAANPDIQMASGGRAATFRGTDAASPDPTVGTWIHDFVTGVTEPVAPGGVADPKVLGIAADGDTLLYADAVGTPFVWQRSTGTVQQIEPPDSEPGTTKVVPIALSADGRSGWLQWSRVISDPSEAPTGLATFEHDGDPTTVSVTMLDERLPLGGSPSLVSYLRDAGGTVELVSPAGVIPLPQLGDSGDLTAARLTDAQADGSFVVAFSSVETDLTGAGSSPCDSGPCGELYRITVRDGAVGPLELLSIGDGGQRIGQSVDEIAMSPSGELVAFTTTSDLVAGLTTPGVQNVFLAGTQDLRSISSFEVVSNPIQGGSSPAFVSANEVVFYATLEARPAQPAGEVPVPGLWVAQIQPFDDMAVTVHEGSIWWAVTGGVTEGCAPDRYCPESAVTRGQIASLLARVLDLASLADGPFSDVDGIHAGSINAIAAAGITNGCTATSFCAEEPVSRAQLATFLARAFALQGAGESPFDDVSGVHEPAITAIYEAGITNGCRPTGYCPAQSVTRAQAATFLFRAAAG